MTGFPICSPVLSVRRPGSSSTARASDTLVERRSASPDSSVAGRGERRGSSGDRVAVTVTGGSSDGSPVSRTTSASASGTVTGRATEGYPGPVATSV